MSFRHLCSFALPLTIVTLAFAGCSASGGDSTGNSRPLGSGGGGSGGPGPILNTGGGPSLGVQPTAGTDAGGAANACGQVLPVIYRDFKGSGETGGHPDFEASGRKFVQMDGSIFKGWNNIGCGLVESALTNGKPVAYTGLPETKDGVNVLPGLGRRERTVSGPGCWTKENPTPTGVCGIGTCAPWSIEPPKTYSIKDGTTFSQWYTTTAGVNMELPGQLMLTETPAGSGLSVYDSTAFFPIDNQGFGNTPGQTHNYAFTTEIHVKFTYQAKQKFTFRGDDDLWIFVNGKLALDVGGQHQALEGTIDFDTQAAALGITVGSSYPMDIFHAERQTTDSNFRIETNIKCFEPAEVVK